MSTLTESEAAARIEAACLDAAATRTGIEKLCAEARQHKLYGVRVTGSRVLLACALLEDTEVKTTALVGFPSGVADADVKRYETEVAIDHGAHEIEFSLSIGPLKDGDRGYVLREMRDIAEAADERPVYVAMAMGLMLPEEQLVVCELALDSGVHGIVLSHGFEGADLAGVRKLREALGPKFLLKSAIGFVDGIQALFKAGVNRISTQDAAALLSSFSS